MSTVFMTSELHVTYMSLWNEYVLYGSFLVQLTH